MFLFCFDDILHFIQVFTTLLFGLDELVGRVFYPFGILNLLFHHQRTRGTPPLLQKAILHTLNCDSPQVYEFIRTQTDFVELLIEKFYSFLESLPAQVQISHVGRVDFRSQIENSFAPVTLLKYDALL